MAKLLTRGQTCSLMTCSSLFVRFSSSSSSSSSSATCNVANFISQAPPLDPSSLNNNYCTSTPIMESKNTKVSESGNALKEHEREGHYKGSYDYPTIDDIMPHILNLYASRATPGDFEMYAMDASFEDPLTAAYGVKEIKSAFYSLGKVFSESRIVEYTVRENIISPGKKEILIDNKQYYKFMGRDIDMISLITLHTEGGKIVRHEDWWNKKPLWNRDTVQVPVVGRATEVLRRGLMLTTHALMGFGKD